MKKKLVLTFLLAALTVQPVVVALPSWTNKPRQAISKISQETRAWFSKKENREFFAQSVGVGVGLLAIGGCSFYLYKKRQSSGTSQNNSSGHQKKGPPAGMLFHRHNDNGEVEILLGLNCNNHWQDFGGLADSGDADAKFTAAREASEELSFICDDASSLNFGDGFDVTKTETFKTFSSALEHKDCFCVQGEKHPNYCLFAVPGSVLPDVTKHGNNRDVLIKKGAKYEYIEAHQIRWLSAKDICERIKVAQGEEHPAVVIEGEEFLIRNATLPTMKPALKMLLKKD